MRVLVVSNHWTVNDTKTFAGIFVDRQVDSLRNIGLQIDTFDIGVNHSPFVLFQQWRNLRRMAKDVDIVHARYGTIVAFISVFSGKPTVITFAGSDVLPGASISRLRTFIGILLSNLASLFASAVICVSDEIHQALWWRKKKTFVIPDGVDLHLFTPGNQVDARQKLGWSRDHVIAIINAARDPQNKGLPLANEAMEYVKKSIPDAELKILQDIQPNNMPFCYRAADVLISASRQEGSPNVIKEALACNLPVISTPVGDAYERLAGVCPSAVVPRNGWIMGVAILRILQARQRSNGRQFVMDLGLERIACKVCEVYSLIIK